MSIVKHEQIILLVLEMHNFFTVKHLQNCCLSLTFTVWSCGVEAIVTASAPVRGWAGAPADSVHTSVPLQNPVIGVPQGASSIWVSLPVTYCWKIMVKHGFNDTLIVNLHLPYSHFHSPKSCITLFIRGLKLKNTNSKLSWYDTSLHDIAIRRIIWITCSWWACCTCCTVYD